MSIRILLVDDHPILRQGLRVLLEREPDFAVVGESADGLNAMLQCNDGLADVVLMDVCMPGLDGMEATRRLVTRGSTMKVLGLSARNDQQTASGMLEAGAWGLVAKDSLFEELAMAIRRVMAGKVYLSPGLSSPEEQGSGSGSIAEPPGSGLLTPREREVLKLVADGRATKEIAFLLARSVKTVETHRQNLMVKVGVNSVAELTKYAIREGITTL